MAAVGRSVGVRWRSNSCIANWSSIGRSMGGVRQWYAIETMGLHSGEVVAATPVVRWQEFDVGFGG